MKTIVFLSDGTMHSAWFSVKEANNQIRVLNDYGYKRCYYEKIDHNYENGHYFV